MDINISENARQAFESCDLNKSITGKTPDTGTQCWIFYQDEKGSYNKTCLKCSYFKEFEEKSEIQYNLLENKTSHIILSGFINDKQSTNFKNTLEKAKLDKSQWILVDFSDAQKTSTPILGVLLRFYKSLDKNKVSLFVILKSGDVHTLFEITKLSRILPIVSDIEDANIRIDQHKQAVIQGEIEKKKQQKQKALEQAKTLKCWVFFNGQNPNNATSCEICHFKASGSNKPCWLIKGEIEGVEFEYTNEGCHDCSYYLKFNPDIEVQEL